jgi:hypothetical protein
MNYLSVKFFFHNAFIDYSQINKTLKQIQQDNYAHK